MSQSSKVYRLDKFIVPATARDQFLAKILSTHAILRQQPGFIQDAVLEQTSGPGKFNIVTMVEWQSQDAIDAAKIIVQELHAKTDFSPQQTMQRLGIQADIANYSLVS
ncbi:antibiotic biosynthesis monooxygenase family protein [Paraglaciecola sp.]|uniref:antibiotic biosynthesis monooxygenase family protein n=1 Tax=Paraglaciecola sp. TaxID=1920173 RepID=UPI0030F3A650